MQRYLAEKARIKGMARRVLINEVFFTVTNRTVYALNDVGVTTTGPVMRRLVTRLQQAGSTELTVHLQRLFRCLSLDGVVVWLSLIHI